MRIKSLQEMAEIAKANNLQIKEMAPGVYKVLTYETRANIDALKTQIGDSIFLFSSEVQYVPNKDGYYDRECLLYYILTDLDNNDALMVCSNEIKEQHGSCRTYCWEPSTESVDSIDTVYSEV